MHIFTSRSAITFALRFGSTWARIFLRYDMWKLEPRSYLSFSPKGGGGKKKGKKRRVHSKKIGNNLSATRSSSYSSNFRHVHRFTNQLYGKEAVDGFLETFCLRRRRR
jgi:hypothetical protein